MTPTSRDDPKQIAPLEDGDVDQTRRGLTMTLVGALGASALFGGCRVSGESALDEASEDEQPEYASAVQQALDGTNNVRWFDTIASMRAFSIGVETNYTAIVHGYGAIGDGGGGVFVWSAIAARDDGKLGTSSYSGTVVNPLVGGTINPNPAAGWRRLYSGGLDPRWFGATGAGVSDDSTALQATINYALSATRARTIVLSAQHLVRTPLIIDRAVDTTQSEFRIVGAGPGAGFYADTSLNLFDSAIPVTAHPKSEFVSFEGVHFEAASPNLLVNVLAPDKFLRMKFHNCNFRKVRLVQNAIYLQTFHLSNCNVRGWDGYFILCRGSYDLSVVNNIVEAGGANSTFIRSVDTSNVVCTYGMRVLGNLIEGLTGIGLELGGCRGCAIHGNYFESVGSGAPPLFLPTIALWPNNIPHSGLSIAGNFFGTHESEENHWAIYWGSGQAVSSGNWAHGRLHYNTDPGPALQLNSINDAGTIETFKTVRAGFFPSTAGGAPQSTASITGGVGVPSNAHGDNGHFYLRSDTPGISGQRIYIKSGGVWIGLI